MSPGRQRVLIVNGHPDPASKGLCHALCDAYAQGARETSREVRWLDIARLDFDFLRSQAEFEKGSPPPAIVEAQSDIRWADHLVIIYPLWLGDMPALLKAFLEQALRPGFAFDYRVKGRPATHMDGRSVRIIVTMGMPALAYRFYYRAHGLKNLESNVLRFVGFGPIRDTLLGSVETCGPGIIRHRLNEVRELGRLGR